MSFLDLCDSHRIGQPEAVTKEVQNFNEEMTADKLLLSSYKSIILDADCNNLPGMTTISTLL